MNQDTITTTKKEYIVIQNDDPHEINILSEGKLDVKSNLCYHSLKCVAATIHKEEMLTKFLLHSSVRSLMMNGWNEREIVYFVADVITGEYAGYFEDNDEINHKGGLS